MRAGPFRVPGDPVPRMNHEPDSALPDVAERRMANQLARVFRGTYGATAGLRVVTTSVAHQMLVAGRSPDVVAGALARCVLTHADRTGADVADTSRKLVALTAECVVTAARDAAKDAQQPRA